MQLPPAQGPGSRRLFLCGFALGCASRWPSEAAGAISALGRKGRRQVHSGAVQSCARSRSRCPAWKPSWTVCSRAAENSQVP